MELNDDIIKKYAKKITGFAFSKTRDVELAKDLSQDILLSLAQALPKQENIENMDSFVHTICCYTWSNHLRKNKKHWNNVSIDSFFDLQSEDEPNTQEDTKILIEKLRVEIAYLTKLHRQIILMFYFENKTSDEISKVLNIPHSTVRWHLGEIKKKLKEGLEMTTDNLNYIPQKLNVGHSGFVNDFNMYGLGHDRVVDNICIACYGTPLTIEEIARKLMIATGYIEGNIEKLVYMDYLKVVKRNKYITNFRITTPRDHLLSAKFAYHNIGEYALKIHEAFICRYDKIKEIGFLGNHLDRDFVLWALMPLVINKLTQSSINDICKYNVIRFSTPIRKDGSKHWVCAELVDDNYFKTQTEFTKEEVEFLNKTTSCGIKTRNADTEKIWSLQIDTRAVIDIGLNFRDFESQHLKELSRIAEIIKNQETPNDFDKTTIAKQAELGYVNMQDEKANMLIPYFSKEQFCQLNIILDQIIEELTPTIFVPYYKKYEKNVNREIPSFVSKGEREGSKFPHPMFAVLAWLANFGHLRYPTDDESKRICTVVWNV